VEGKGVMRTYFVDRFAAGDAESKAVRSALARKALRSALARVGTSEEQTGALAPILDTGCTNCTANIVVRHVIHVVHDILNPRFK